MGYRPDIDGLRAIAVASVVVFHFFPGALPSGYVGVDVFFVISGYLITSLITSDLMSARFDIRIFYFRRVRRIFPALILVLCSGLVTGWFLFLPAEYAASGKQVAGGAGFVANYVFWGESGYFDESAISKPFLHLWSLGIEEQFYILYPLLLWLSWRLRFPLWATVFVFLVMSLAYSTYLSQNDPTAAFYSPLSRAWELLCGAALALWQLERKKNLVSDSSPTLQVLGSFQKFEKSNIYELFTVLGFALLGIGLYVINEDSAFPVFWGVPPVLGACLILFAGNKSRLSLWLLGSSPVTYLGLISYPLYLWHWPVLVIPTTVGFGLPSPWVRVGLLGLSVVLAVATYHLVETPIRRRIKVWKQALWIVALLLFVGIAGASIWLMQGVPHRGATQMVELYSGDIGHDSYHENHQALFPVCTPQEISHTAPVWKGFRRCRQSQADTPIQIAIVGDSHAEHLFYGLAKTRSENVAYYIKNSVPTLANPEFTQIFEEIVKNKNISTVVMSAYWTFRMREISDESSLYLELEKTLRQLSVKKRVLLLEDTPTFSFKPSVCKYKRRLRGNTTCEMTNKWYIKRNNMYMEGFGALERQFPNVNVVPMSDAFCTHGTCSMTKDGKILFRDASHLNLPGSVYIARLLSNAGWFDG